MKCHPELNRFDVCRCRRRCQNIRGGRLTESRGVTQSSRKTERDAPGPDPTTQRGHNDKVLFRSPAFASPDSGDTYPRPLARRLPFRGTVGFKTAPVQGLFFRDLQNAVGDSFAFRAFLSFLRHSELSCACQSACLPACSPQLPAACKYFTVCRVFGRRVTDGCAAEADRRGGRAGMLAFWMDGLKELEARFCERGAILMPFPFLLLSVTVAVSIGECRNAKTVLSDGDRLIQ